MNKVSKNTSMRESGEVRFKCFQTQLKKTIESRKRKHSPSQPPLLSLRRMSNRAAYKTYKTVLEWLARSGEVETTARFLFKTRDTENCGALTHTDLLVLLDSLLKNSGLTGVYQSLTQQELDKVLRGVGCQQLDAVSVDHWCLCLREVGEVLYRFLVRRRAVAQLAVNIILFVPVFCRWGR